ncbi:MAG: hypothetical protein P4L50_30455, partial [Anaerolineaceae bacterium]|nr:hypothetical protein [Anaerolineaceae bacterium]
MLKTCLITAMAAIWLAASPTAKAGVAFDGQWTATVVCPDYQDALGVNFHFGILIQNGQVQGSYGQPGQPGSGMVTGTVGDDGTLTLSGSAITKDPAYAVGHVPAGTTLTFTVNGKLDNDSGQGTRTETRPCTFYFNKAP